MLRLPALMSHFMPAIFDLDQSAEITALIPLRRVALPAATALAELATAVSIGLSGGCTTIDSTIASAATTAPTADITQRACLSTAILLPPRRISLPSEINVAD